MEYIRIIVLIIGVILLIIGCKRPTHKYAKITGIIIIVVCLVVGPGFIKGFIEGWQSH